MNKHKKRTNSAGNQMSNNKMVFCKSCGEPIEKNTKICPACGAKQKLPLLVRGCLLPIFWFFASILLMGLVAGVAGFIFRSYMEGNIPVFLFLVFLVLCLIYCILKRKQKKATQAVLQSASVEDLHNKQNLSVSIELLIEDNEEDLSPDEYLQIRQREEDLLERTYDLSTVAGINAIPVPTEKEKSSEGLPSVTGRIEYYLLHKAALYEKEKKVELALACYRKANALMPMSPISYDRDRFLRLPRYLRKLGRIAEAELEEKHIDDLFEGDYKYIGQAHWAENRWKRLLEEMEIFDTDLVEASYIRACCAECAKYRERVYSFSGKDKRYPKLPDHLKRLDHDCGILLSPFINDIHSIRTRNGKDLRGKQVIKHSNRPFVDDRAPEEIADYEKGNIR